MLHKNIVSKNNSALLIIDLQEKFASVIPNFNEIVTNTIKLVLACELFKIPVIVTQQYPQGLGNTVEILKKQFLPDFIIIDKIEFSATENKVWKEKIDPLDINSFIVCGIETHVCINQTVHSLLSKDKVVHVVSDATGSRKNRDHDVAIRKMENSGAVITTTEMCLFELAERAGTSEFKSIQLMVKGPIKVPVILEKTKSEKQINKIQKISLDKETTEKKEIKTPKEDILDLEDLKKQDILSKEAEDNSSKNTKVKNLEEQKVDKQAEENDAVKSINDKIDALEPIGNVEDMEKEIANLDEIINKSLDNGLEDKKT